MGRDSICPDCAWHVCVYRGCVSFATRLLTPSENSGGGRPLLCCLHCKLIGNVLSSVPDITLTYDTAKLKEVTKLKE